MPGLQDKLKDKFGESVTETHAQHGDETAVVTREAFLEIARYLKQDPGMDMNVLIDVTAVDLLGMKLKPRYEAVYHFLSTRLNHRLRVKVRVDEKDPVMPTLTGLWAAANWFEREVWDMFGIRFEGHPNLKRILMYEEFTGHPLRKDYPYSKRQPLIGPQN